MVTIVDRYLEAILKHLRCSIMSQPPTGDAPKCCLRFHLIVVFLSIFKILHNIFKMAAGKGDAPCTLGISVKYFYSQKTRQVQKILFQLNRMSEIDSSRF